jgi:hypothetical protein
VQHLPSIAIAESTPLATGSFLLRLGLVDLESAALQISTVQTRDRGVRFRVRAHFDKTKAFALACIPICYQID